MTNHSFQIGLRTALAALAIPCGMTAAYGQLNQNCTVSVLNRTVPVNADGTWVLPNVPANFGQTKARATCVQNGTTIFGESAFFTIPANGAVNLPAITLGAVTQIPSALTITPAAPTLTTAGQTVQLGVTATYPTSATKNITAASTGTNYTISNPAIATITANGLVTAVSSGTVVIQANNDGATAITTVSVSLGGTTVGGIPVSWLLDHKLNPNDPLVAQEDPDRDGLTNLDEFKAGTDPNNPDTDGDGLNDGDEVNKYKTSPLLADTDGDGIPDGVEVQNGTNPTDKSSYDLKKAVLTSTVTPPSFTLQTSNANPVVSVQLSWKVTLIDNKTILDLTADPRTNYSSSDLNICGFGGQPGLIFSVGTGSCVITISQNSLSVPVPGTVTGFSPVEVSALAVPGAVAVDVAGAFAYIAAGSNGLAVVDVSDRTKPKTRGTLGGLGNAQAVRASGQNVFIADANGFIRIVNAQSPDSPTLTSSLAITGNPTALSLHGATLAVAAQTGGVSLVNVGNPASPSLIARFTVPGSALGVDFDPQSGIAAVAMGTSGLQVADLSTPASPKLRGLLAGGNVQRVILKLPAALLADSQRSITAVDMSKPDQPVLSSSLPGNLGGSPVDIAAFGNIAMTADVSFGRVIPIVNISSPLNPSSVGFWTLASPGFSSSIAVDLSFGYTIIPATGTLRILKYQNIVDTLGIPPVISITSPITGPLIQGATVTLSANATDDVAVASVNLMVNGLVALVTSSPPYQTSYTLPSSATTITFGATALDYGNNLGVATNVTLPVIPDPLTTVKGRVVDTVGSPVSGASYSALGQSGLTAADGTFTLAGLPTIRGAIVVNASATIAGVPLFGQSQPAQPVPGGIANVGDIRLAPKPFIISVGPTAILAGTSGNMSITGANLAGSSFTFVPSGGITAGAPSINAAGTAAAFSITVAASANGRYTLVGTNPAGSSDSTPVVGFVTGSPAFNTISVPGSNPNADPDNDGLTNAQEIAAKTDPLNADTDGDSALDGLEVALGSDPLNPGSLPNSNARTGYVSSQPFSALNSVNPSAGAAGVPQFVSSQAFSILNNVDPNQGLPGITQYVSGQTFSLLNAVNPSTGVTGTPQFVSGQTFSILNAVDPNAGLPGITQYVSGQTFSLLNAVNPSVGVTGTPQFVSGQTFSLLNGVSPAPATASAQFISGPTFSIFNSIPPGPGTLFLRTSIGSQVARPWMYLAREWPLLDSDGDGIADEEERLIGTDPFKADTDGDGYPDGLEIALGSDPLDRKSIPNLNAPGLVVSPMVHIQNLNPLAKIRAPGIPVALRRPQ